VGNTVVAGTGPFIITFQGTLAGTSVPTMTFNGSALTSGSIASLTTTTPGGSTVTVNKGATLTLDNTGTNVATASPTPRR